MATDMAAGAPAKAAAAKTAAAQANRHQDAREVTTAAGAAPNAPVRAPVEADNAAR